MEILKAKRNRIISLTTGALVGAVLLSSVSCSENEREFDRSEMIGSIGQDVITPTNDDLLTASQDLGSATQELCNDATADNLAAAQQAWLEVKEPLKRAESFSFGPYRVPRVQISMSIDKWPGRGSNIETVIASEDEIDQAYIEGLDYRDRIKGYPAIGYLLYGAPEGSDTLDTYTSEDGARRCEYLLAVTEHAGEIITEYHNRWSSEGGGYIDQFVDAGSTDSFPSEQDAITALAGAMLFALTDTAEMKLGIPLYGADGEPLPEDVEAPYSQTSVDHALWSLQGVEALYLGTDEGLGLSDCVQFRQASGSVDETVRQRLDAALAAVEALDEPLADTVANDGESVQAAIDRIEELKQAISGEVSTLLGINPTTVEGDND